MDIECEARSQLDPASLDLPTPTAPSLPPELIDIVVDHLHDDIATLRELTLVSQQWFYPSQYHLFYSVRIQAYPSNCSRKLKQFAEDTPPRIKNLARKFTLEWGPPIKARWASRQLRREPRVDLALLLSVLRELPSLHTLVLHACILECPDTTYTQCALQSLRKLVLADVRGTVAMFNALLPHIPVYNTLHMLDNTIIDDPDTPGPANPVFELPPSMYDINSLVIVSKYHAWQHRATGLFYNHLLSVPIHLTSLDAGAVFSSQGVYDGVSKLIRERGKALTHLRLDISWTNYSSDSRRYHYSLDEFNLTTFCPNLQVLHIGISATCMPSHPYYDRNNSCQFEDAAFVLSMTPPTVRKLIIAIQKQGPKDDMGAMDAVNLTKMDETISRFMALEVVQFQKGHWPHPHLEPMAECPRELPQHLRDFFINRLPIVYSRGLLQFF